MAALKVFRTMAMASALAVHRSAAKKREAGPGEETPRRPQG